MQSIHQELVNTLDFQKNTEAIEWQVMSNNPTVILLSDEKAETSNAICTITRVVDALTGGAILLTQMDINTSAQNMLHRFSDEDLDLFSGAAREIISKARSELEVKWNEN